MSRAGTTFDVRGGGDGSCSSSSCGGGRLCMATRRRTGVTSEHVVGLVPRRSRNARAHRRSGTSLGFTAGSTSGSFRPRVGVGGRATPGRRPRVRDEPRSQRDGACCGNSCDVARSGPAVPTMCGRPVAPTRAQAPGSRSRPAGCPPRAVAATGGDGGGTLKPIVQGRATTCQENSTQASTQDCGW